MGCVSRHRCLIYEGSPARQLPMLAAIALGKLDASNRCMYLNSPAMVAGFRSYLAASGVDVEDQVRKGALVLSSDQSHLVAGRFDVNRMLDKLLGAMNQALADGFQGLWATGDMLWELGSEKNFDKILEYEIGLEEVLQNNPALCGVCQYHRDSLPVDAIGAALDTHQSVYVNETLARVNPFYKVRPARAEATPSTLAHIGERLDRLQKTGDS